MTSLSDAAPLAEASGGQQAAPSVPSGAPSAADRHIPVLFAETMEALSVKKGGRYLDGTLGMGGHSEGILRAGGHVLGLDQDLQALDLARARLAPFEGNFHAAHSAFADFAPELEKLGWESLDGALVDLGVSSFQIDTPERGFSFLADGPLDMRMDKSGGAQPGTAPAANLVNRAPVKTLKKIIEEYGEDPQAGAIARAIENARNKAPIETTAQLAHIVEMAYPPKWRAKARNHPATRTFQALRMVVNNELEQLELFLRRIVPFLAPGGRLAVISFHSLEDRMVKHFLREEATDCLCPPHIMRCSCGHRASLEILDKKGVTPSEKELAANPRSSSARLRSARKI